MSIDVQEAIKAIRDMRPIIDPEEDYLTIVAAEERFAASETRRKKELEEAQANLKALAKVLETARQSCTRPASVPSAQEHAATLNQCDSAKYSLMKSISDMQNEIGSKEAELAALKEEARRLEEYDPATEHEKELDGSALRLAIYQGLGFEPVPDKNGDITKMLVRSQSGDIHVVDFTIGKSNFEYTQELWNLATS